MGLVDVFTTAASLMLATTCLIPPTTAAGTCANRQQPVPSAIIPQGTIKGFRDASCNSVYLGIPFAATTGGQNR